MDRVLELSPGHDAGVPRRLATTALLTASSALARLAARIERPAAAARPARIEVTAIEVGGARHGAVYADGQLLGFLPVDRL